MDSQSGDGIDRTGNGYQNADPYGWGVLKRWGYTPQKPVKRAYEQNPKALQRWLDDEYPEIKSRAKKENAEIYGADEAGMRNDSQHERGYASKGKTPVVRLNAKRTSTNMISAITNQGKVRFKLFEGGMNVEIMIDFCKRLIKTAERKIYLIVDNLRVHHAKLFKASLAEHKEEIEVFYLPSYSPEIKNFLKPTISDAEHRSISLASFGPKGQKPKFCYLDSATSAEGQFQWKPRGKASRNSFRLNPDEYLNCDLKAGVHSARPARTKEQLKKKVTSHMRMLQRKAQRVKKYFEHGKINYAAG